jgi:hypothetical protein
MGRKTLYSTAGVAEVVEADLPHDGLGPEKMVVLGATALDGVWSWLGVTAALVGANMSVALHDAGSAEGAAEDAFERDVVLRGFKDARRLLRTIFAGPHCLVLGMPRMLRFLLGVRDRHRQ